MAADEEFEGVPLSRLYVIEDEVQQLGYLDNDVFGYAHPTPALAPRAVLVPTDVERAASEALARRWRDQARAAMPPNQWTHLYGMSPWREPLP